MSTQTAANLETAKLLHQEMMIVDTHHDIAMDVHHRRVLGEQGVLSGRWAKILRAGGVDVQVLPLFIEDDFLPERGLRCMLQQLEAVRSDLEDDDSVMKLATNMRSIRLPARLVIIQL